MTAQNKVLANQTQNLSENEKVIARNNIGADSIKGFVECYRSFTDSAEGDKWFKICELEPGMSDSYSYMYELSMKMISTNNGLGSNPAECATLNISFDGTPRLNTGRTEATWEDAGVLSAAWSSHAVGTHAEEVIKGIKVFRHRYSDDYGPFDKVEIWLCLSHYFTSMSRLRVEALINSGSRTYRSYYTTPTAYNLPWKFNNGNLAGTSTDPENETDHPSPSGYGKEGWEHWWYPSCPKTVMVDRAQEFTDTEKAQAQENLGIQVDQYKRQFTLPKFGGSGSYIKVCELDISQFNNTDDHTVTDIMFDLSCDIRLPDGYNVNYEGVDGYGFASLRIDAGIRIYKDFSDNKYHIRWNLKYRSLELEENLSSDSNIPTSIRLYSPTLLPVGEDPQTYEPYEIVYDDFDFAEGTCFQILAYSPGGYGLKIDRISAEEHINRSYEVCNDGFTYAKPWKFANGYIASNDIDYDHSFEYVELDSPLIDIYSDKNLTFVGYVPTKYHRDQYLTPQTDLLEAISDSINTKAPVMVPDRDLNSTISSRPRFHFSDSDIFGYIFKGEGEDKDRYFVANRSSKRIYITDNRSKIIGGRVYDTTVVGGQTWMAENLDMSWSGLLVHDENHQGRGNNPRATYYNYAKDTYGVDGNQNGLLYNYYAVEWLNEHIEEIAPGWRVASSTDYEELFDCYANADLRSTSDWTNGNGNDIFGLNFEPCGENTNGAYSQYFQDIGLKAVFRCANSKIVRIDGNGITTETNSDAYKYGAVRLIRKITQEDSYIIDLTKGSVTYDEVYLHANIYTRYGGHLYLKYNASNNPWPFNTIWTVNDVRYASFGEILCDSYDPSPSSFSPRFYGGYIRSDTNAWQRVF